MPPPPPRKYITKSQFPALFASAKTQTYHDPSTRSPGSHTIRTIAWNPSGTLIATGSADRTLRIWNPEKPQVKNSTELKGHTAAIERVAFNPTKDAELASVSGDGTCRFWDVRNKQCIAVVSLGGEGLTVAWAGDGSVVMVGRKVYIKALKQTRKKEKIETPSPNITLYNIPSHHYLSSFHFRLHFSAQRE